MISGTHLTVIKAYSLREPVWAPEELVDEFKLLADPLELWRRIELQSRRGLRKTGLFRKRPRWQIEGLGWVKPIRNPWYRGSRFWLNLFPAHLRRLESLDFRRPLPLFPLQVIPFQSAAQVAVDRAALARWLDPAALADVKASAQLAVYPAGMVCSQVRLALEWRGAADLAGLGALADGVSAWPVSLSGGVKGLFPVLDSLAARLTGALVKHDAPPDRETAGCFLVCSPWGLPAPEGPEAEALAGLLPAGAWLPPDLTGAADSCIGATGWRAVAYVDAEMARRRVRSQGPGGTDLLNGRHFFRQKLLTTVEVAHVSAALLRDYRRQFATLEHELDQAALETDAISRVINWFTVGVLSPRAYGTLADSVFLARDRLGEDLSGNGALWQALYDQVMAGQGALALLQELSEASRRVYDMAGQYRTKRAADLRSAAEGIGKLVDRLVPVLVKIQAR